MNTAFCQPEKACVSPNDKVRLATIGLGIMGYNDTRTALACPGTELVAACDLYTGRLDHAKEDFGASIFTTKNYHEILDRKDIDAVIIATSDNWHSTIAEAAMRKRQSGLQRETDGTSHRPGAERNKNAARNQSGFPGGEPAGEQRHF